MPPTRLKSVALARRVRIRKTSVCDFCRNLEEDVIDDISATESLFHVG